MTHLVLSEQPSSDSHTPEGGGGAWSLTEDRIVAMPTYQSSWSHDGGIVLVDHTIVQAL